MDETKYKFQFVKLSFFYIWKCHKLVTNVTIIFFAYTSSYYVL